MKPMSPEERELEELRSGLSGRYRASSTEEPPAHLDAAIVAAARREVERSRFRRSWHVPATIAAVLVIGVSLAVFTIYYVGLIGGEELGDRLIVTPFISMWVPNLVFSAVGLLGLWSLRREGWSARAGGWAELRDLLRPPRRRR